MIVGQKKMEELNKIGLRHIWQNPNENQRGTAYKEIKQRCNDIERLNVFRKFKREKITILL
jgi:hypothetical protein